MEAGVTTSLQKVKKRQHMETYTEDPICQKCGNKKADSQFLGNGLANSLSLPHEVIKRICKECGYEWYEKPLDME